MEQVPRPLGELTVAQFVDRLSTAEPVPGGGSASAVVGSIGASLLTMVARLSLDRPRYEAYRATNERALATGSRASRRLLELADDDARSYAGFAAARRMPRATDDEQRARDEATRAAAREASEVPLEVVRECVRLMGDIAATAGRSNLNAASDLEVAARLAAAAARGAAANVMINLPMVGDERFAGVLTAEINGLIEGVERMLLDVVHRVGTGALRDPEQG